MPTFEWNVDPVAFRIPKLVLIVVLAAIGGLTIVGGLRRKATDAYVFGGLFLAAAGLVHVLAKESFEVRWYSLIFVLVFVGGYVLLNWQVRRGGGDPEDAGDFIVYGVLGVLIGARLGHVIFYDLEKALKDPMWVFAIWTGGLASHGAVTGLIIAMWMFTKRRGVPFLEGSDRFAFSAALGATLVRIGNFFNSEIVGIRTNGSWGVRLPNGPDAKVDAGLPLRHPTQLYEAAIGIFVLIALFIFDRALGKEKRPRGALISLFFFLYFPLRFVVEFYKEHQVFKDSTLDMGHYLSIPGFLLGAYGLFWSFKHRLPAGWTPERRGEEFYDEDEDFERDDEDEDEDEADEDEEEERRARRRRRKRKAKSEARLEHDPDVDEEFEAGELAKRRPAIEGTEEGAEGAERAEGEAPPKKKKKKKKKKKRAS